MPNPSRPQSASTYKRAVLFLLAALCVTPALAQFTLQTAAGGGPNNIPAVGANSNVPQHINFTGPYLYVADAGENRIFRIDPTGTITVIAGSGWADATGGVPTGDGGLSINANVVKPAAVAVDGAPNVYFVDLLGLHKASSTGIITTLAGTGCLAYDANLEFPMPLALNPYDTTVLYCVTSANNAAGAVVSQVDLSTFVVTPVAGGGSSTADNVSATSERLSTVNGLAVTRSGDLYIACSSCNKVYKVSNGLITHIAGGGILPPNNNVATSVSLSAPSDVAVDSSNNVFISEFSKGVIYRVDGTTQIITQYAGGGSCVNPPYINDGGPALNACFNEAVGMAVDTSTNDLYFSDSDLNSTFFVDPWYTDHLVRRISAAAPNIIQTAVGNVFPASLPLQRPGQAGGFEFFSGDGFPAVDARIGPTPQGLAVDPAGNLFIGDTLNHAVRRVDATTSVISSITPNPGALSSIAPYFVAAGPDGTPYANTAYPLGPSYPTPSYPASIFAIGSGGLTAVANFTGTSCAYTADGAAANSGCIGYPQGIALDSAGNMYVADRKFCTIREISPLGILSTVTGAVGSCAPTGDGGSAANATVGGPTQLASDAAGTVWFADCGSATCGVAGGFAIRKISADRTSINTVWTPPVNTMLQALTVDNHGNGLAQIYSPAASGGICGVNGYCIIQIGALDNSVTVIAGAGSSGLPSSDGVSATGATLGCAGVSPTLLGGMAINAKNQIFFTEGCSGFNFAVSSGTAWGTNSVVRRLDPLVVTSLAFTPSSVAAGGITTGTVTLSGPAPPGGAIVALSSNNSALQVPSTVKVFASQTAASFTATASAAAAQVVGVTATYNSAVANASVTVQAGPSVVSLSPTAGTGMTQTFTMVYSDSSGVADLKEVFVLINTPFRASAACYVAYVPSTNLMYLYSNAGTGVTSTAVTPGSSAVAGNSQCSLAGTGSSVATSGNNLTLNVALTFYASFAGQKSVFLNATGQTATSGWIQKGTWTPAIAGPPSVTSITPSAGASVAPIFSINYADPSGAADLSEVFVLFNTTLNPSNACYVGYVVATNKMYLYNDAGTAFLTTAVTPGAAVSASNSQCTLNGANSAISATADNLTLTVSLTFSGTFLGQKNAYELAAGKTQSSGWVQKGTWTTSPPFVLSESPSSGTGLVQTFTAVYVDPSGIPDLTSVSLIVGPTQGANSCNVNYSPATNQLQLGNNAGTGFLPTTVTPGTATSVSNSQCTLNGLGSSVTISGNNLTLNAALTFASTFYGQQRIGAYAVGKTATAGQIELGFWTPAPYPAPSVISLSPTAGTGLTQTFTVVYTGIGEPQDYALLVLINNTFNPAGACYFAFGAGNYVGLYNDAGTASSDVYFGTGTVSNSQCTLNGIGSSFSISGQTITLNVSVTFNPAFTGSKNVYADVVGSASGWTQMGTWTP